MANASVSADAILPRVTRRAGQSVNHLNQLTIKQLTISSIHRNLHRVQRDWLEGGRTHFERKKQNIKAVTAVLPILPIQLSTPPTVPAAICDAPAP